MQPHPKMKNLEHNVITSGAACAVELNNHQHLEADMNINKADCASLVLREIPGNDVCAECSAPEPDWASSIGEGSLGCHIIDLRTSTIKMDAEDTDLRLCFRIISPLKMYTLQVIY